MIWGLSSPSRVVQKRQDSRSSEEVAAWGSGGNLDALGSSPGHGTVSPAHPPTHLPPAKRGAATHTPALWVAHSGMFLGNPLRGASARGPTWDDVHRNSYTNGARARAPTGTEGTVAAAAHTYARTLGRPQTLEASRGVRTAHIPVPRQSTGPIHRLPSPHPCPPPPIRKHKHAHAHTQARALARTAPRPEVVGCAVPAPSTRPAPRAWERPRACAPPRRGPRCGAGSALRVLRSAAVSEASEPGARITKASWGERQGAQPGRAAGGARRKRRGRAGAAEAAEAAGYRAPGAGGWAGGRRGGAG